jgi:RHS repeat-associated protein
VVDGTGYNASTVTFPYNAGLNGTTTSTGAGPKAYLNWLVFDRNYNFIVGASGYKQMTNGPREYGQDIAHEKLDGTITITEPGYVYIYLSNENTTPVDVFFDDFKVEHIKSPVVQMDDYYAFGLTYNSYSRENNIVQDFKYNGKEEQDELGLKWLDFGFRMYDPALGRFTGIDPLATKYNWLTPYNYAENSPVANIDLWGLQRYFAADGSLLGQVGDNTDIRVINATMTNQQATEHIQSGSAESTQALTDGSVAFADYFQTVADVTNDAGLETYSANGSNCFTAAKEQLANEGVTQTGSAGAIHTLVNTTKDPGLTENAPGGAIRVQTELNKGNPVMVGVKETKTDGTAPDPGNANSNTGHFVVIRSVTVAADGTVTFNYLDNAKASTGKSADNNFSLNTSTGAMTDTTTPGGRTNYSSYHVSEVRKNN